jgi:hypothetical protein
MAKLAFLGAMGAMALTLITGIMGYWITALAALGLPSARMMDIRCHKCAWFAYARFRTAPGWAAKDQMLHSYIAEAHGNCRIWL